MKKISLVIAVICLSFLKCYAQRVEWIATGSNEENINYGVNGYNTGISSIAEYQETLYAAGFMGGFEGNFGDTIVFSEYKHSFNFLAAYNKDGSVRWVNKAKGVGRPSLAVDKTGNIYYGEEHSFNFSSILTKYDQTGKVVWEKTFPYFYISAITIDHNNDCVIAGDYSGGTSAIALEDTVINSPQGDHLFLMKFDSDGNFKWFRSSNTVNKKDSFIKATIRSTDVNENNDIFFIGDFENEKGDSLILGDTLLTAKVFEFSNPPTISSPRKDIVLGKLSATGEFLWAHAVGGMGDDWGNKIRANDRGNVYFTGTFLDSIEVDGTYHYGQQSEIMLGSISDNNVIQWFRTAGGPGGNSYQGYDAGRALEVIDEDIYMAGSFYSFAEFNSKDTSIAATGKLNAATAYIAKYDADGNPKWIVNGKVPSAFYDLYAVDDKIHFAGFASFYDTESSIFADFPVSFSYPKFGKRHFIIGTFDISSTVVTRVIPENEIQETILFPNPSQGVLNLKSPYPLKRNTRIDIIDAYGKTVLSTAIQDGSKSSYQINALKIANGVYTLVVQNGGQIERIRFIKK